MTHATNWAPATIMRGGVTLSPVTVPDCEGDATLVVSDDSVGVQHRSGLIDRLGRRDASLGSLLGDDFAGWRVAP